MSIHPTIQDSELGEICDAIEAVALHHEEWADDYVYDEGSNEFYLKNSSQKITGMRASWFEL